MITHRRLLFGCVAGALALSAGGRLLWPRSAITQQNAEMIQIGMTEVEVETIFGQSGVPLIPVDEGRRYWVDDEGACMVWFDADGWVQGSHFWSLAYEPPWEVLRRWWFPPPSAFVGPSR